jgi:hypothetical protein
MADMGKGDPQRENLERMVSLARGPKGEEGTQGERGERGQRGEGMTRGTRRAIVFLFALTVALSAASILFTVSYYHRSAAAQQRQGQLLEQKLCATLEPLAGLAGLRPPAGNPGDNPSRAYEQELSAKLAPLAQLGPDLGCAP